MKKKWFKRIAAAAAVLVILFLGTDLALRGVSSADWAREWVRRQAADFLHREVRLQKMSASLFGFKLDGLEIAEQGGFSEGTFFSAQRVRLRVNLFPLLYGHLKLRSFLVNQAEVNVLRREDGTFNFAGMGPEPAPGKSSASSSGLPLNITLNRLVLRNLNITYTDLQNHTKASASDILLQVSRFGFKRKFTVELKSTLTYETGGKVFTVPAGLQAQAYLEDLDFSRAYAEIARFSAQYQDAAVTLRVRAEDFTRPLLHTELTLENFTSAAVAQWLPNVPEFNLPQLKAVADVRLDWQTQTAEVKKFSLEMPGVTGQAAGVWDQTRRQLSGLEASAAVQLKEWAALVPAWAEEYQIQGELTGSAVQKDGTLTAEVSLQDGAGRIPYTGELAGVTCRVQAQEKDGFMEGNAQAKLTGRLNGEPFEGTLSLAQTPQLWQADVKVRAGRVALPPLAQAVPSDADQFVADTTLPVKQRAAWPLPPLSIRADVVVDSLDAPYIYGTDLNFQADLTGVTPDLKNTHGTLRLDMGNGEIKDLYRLTNANAVTKVLFLSVNIVGKVFNTMNVFAVLDGLGSGLLDVVGAGPEEQEADLVVQTVTEPDGTTRQIMVPYTDRKISGRMAYDKFATKVDFKKGIANIQDGTFVSDTVSFTLDGTTNFNSGKLDMTVQAAPGKHEADGIMPLTLKVGGTVSEPKGSMSLIGSVSSLVTQGLGNNFASRSVKKGLGGLLGLFKKEEPQSPAAGEKESADAGAAAVPPGEEAALNSEQINPAAVSAPADALTPLPPQDAAAAPLDAAQEKAASAKPAAEATSAVPEPEVDVPAVVVEPVPDNSAL